MHDDYFEAHNAIADFEFIDIDEINVARSRSLKIFTVYV